MKLSMETMYFPEAKFHHKKEMMADWTRTSEKTAVFSWVALLFSVATAVSLIAFEDDYFFIYFGSAVLFLVGALFCKRWRCPAYYAVIAGEALGLLRFYLETPENKVILVIAVVTAIVGVVPSYFAFRCIYNYKPIFKELEKSEGFPNFIANTADLYGEKIYLHDEESTVYESRNEASYNPFNTKEDIRNEETRRYHDVKAQAETTQPLEMNIDVKGNLVYAEDERDKQKSKEKEARRGGFFIGNYELVFAHGDLCGNDFDEKRMFMGKWRANVEESTNNFAMFVFLLMIAIMASGFGSIMGVINYALVVVFVLGTNQMKMGKWYAPITMLIAVVYSLSLMNSTISAFMLAGAYIFGFRMLTNTIRYALNYKNYRLLSTQTGFPTFIRTTADLYGSKMYIVDKPVAKVRKDPSQRVVRVMDIGYDNKPKKDEGAWNAFDYMDENKEENTTNES